MLTVELEEKKKKKAKPKSVKKVDVSELKEKWLCSMSCPFDIGVDLVGGSLRENGSELDWVVGIDPDISGAIAVLKPDSDGGDYCAQVLYFTACFCGFLVDVNVLFSCIR